MLYRDTDYGKEQNILVSQSKPFDTIVRHIVEISEHDVMTYHKKSHPHRPWTTTLNFAYGNARLVTLAPGLRPERRFAPLARGLIPSYSP